MNVLKSFCTVTLIVGLSTGFAASGQAGPAWGPPGWQNGPLDPGRNVAPQHFTLPDNRQRRVTPPPPPNPTHDPDVQRGIDSYRRPGG